MVEVVVCERKRGFGRKGGERRFGLGAVLGAWVVVLRWWC